MISSSLPPSRRTSHSDLLKGRILSRNLSSSSMEEDSAKTERGFRSRLEDSEGNFSQKSVLSAMNRFVKSVNNMNATVLVPSRLMDMDKGGSPDDAECPLPADLEHTDLYSFFSLLNEKKNELLWGADEAAFSRSSSSTSLQSMEHSSLVRKSSDNSIENAAMASDDSESDAENGAAENTEKSANLAFQLRLHLQGLQSIFHRLADSADYLAVKYRKEIEGL